ncbi:rhamnogalacturonan acetylesterase, partial [Streptomyces neyagawaensis]
MARQIFLVGDSTVCDQPGDPYSGWGQQLPRYLRKGLSVANHADSGESTVSYLADARLWATVRPRIRRGDLVLIQLAHNDKQTDEATYRANLETLVAGVRDQGGRPVLVTPIVRRWFNADGTLNNNTALLVNGLGVDHPAVVRSVAAAHDVPLIDLTARTKALVESLGTEASKALYLSNEKRDNTHTSVHGATVYAGLVRDELVALGLVPAGRTRVG